MNLLSECVRKCRWHLRTHSDKIWDLVPNSSSKFPSWLKVRYGYTQLTLYVTLSTFCKSVQIVVCSLFSQFDSNICNVWSQGNSQFSFFNYYMLNFVLFFLFFSSEMHHRPRTNPWPFALRRRCLIKWRKPLKHVHIVRKSQTNCRTHGA